MFLKTNASDEFCNVKCKISIAGFEKQIMEIARPFMTPEYAMILQLRSTAKSESFG